MIDRQHGRLFMSCDNCGETREDADANDMPYAFEAFIEGAKAEGWTIRKPRGGVFQHYCPDCVPSLPDRPWP